MDWRAGHLASLWAHSVAAVPMAWPAPLLVRPRPEQQGEPRPVQRVGARQAQGSPEEGEPLPALLAGAEQPASEARERQRAEPQPDGPEPVHWAARLAGPAPRGVVPALELPPLMEQPGATPLWPARPGVGPAGEPRPALSRDGAALWQPDEGTRSPGAPQTPRCIRRSAPVLPPRAPWQDPPDRRSHSLDR
jgi:hypothetical protein